MRRLFVAVAICLVACGILPAHAQTLALNFKAGDMYRYSLHLTATFAVTATTAAVTENVKVEAKAKEAATVTSVESDGTADISLAFSDLSVTTTGKTSDGKTTSDTTTQTSALPPQQLRVAPDGRMLSVNGESVSAASPFGVLVGGQLAYAVLPDSAVKPGDKWSKPYDQSQPGGQSSVHVPTNSTYLRDESFHGVNAAMVETKSKATFTMSGSVLGSVDSDTTSWVDPKARRVLKSTSKATLKATITSLETGLTVDGTQNMDLEPA